jgi:FkbM family methyltransferase
MTLERLLRLPLRLVPPGKSVRILSGGLRGWRWITGASTHGCWIGTYERHTQKLFREHIRPGGVVYDIGANAGFFTLLASRLTGQRGRVFAFEPLPRNLGYLRDHVRLNHATNVTVLPLAVAAHEGTARFHVAGSPSMGGLSATGEIEVSLESLDHLLRSGALPRPDFIKMDIEGGEDDALAGAAEVLRTPGLTLLLSTHGHAHHQHCWELLGRAGFDLHLARDGAADGDYLILAARSSGRPSPAGPSSS